MVKTLVTDFNGLTKRKNLTKREIDKIKRERKKEEKILERIRKYDNLPTDTIEEWVNEDFEQMETELDESERFCDELAEYGNIPIKTTGSRWYNYHRPVGRFLKSIRKNCNEHNKTAILIIRSGDPTIYRLGIESGEESKVLHTAISKGYILSKIKVTRVDDEE